MKNKTKKIDSFDILNPYSNSEVTTLYVGMITNSLNNCGFITNTISELKKNDSNKNKGIVVVRTWDAYLAKKAGYSYVITWIQGVAPEETLMTTKNILKYFYVLLFEILGLLNSDFNIYCSQKMKKHYKNHYILRAKNDYIIPCFNEEINLNEIRNKNYENNCFVYCGTTYKWQCFEETIRLYKKIEQLIPNCKLFLYVKDQELSKKILAKYNVLNYEIDFVNPQELAFRMKESKFGFCIRKNVKVNKVATPTKLSNYISNGLIPIYSKCLNSFHGAAKNNPYCVCADDSNFLSKISFLCTKKIDSLDVAINFEKSFAEYYSKTNYVNKLTDLFNSTLMRENRG